MARNPAVKRPNIVVGTDGSAGARIAVMRATRIAAHSGAVLHVVHARGRIPARLARLFGVRASALDAVLEEIVEHARAAGASARLHRLDKSPTQALREVARRVAADLVVVGTRGLAVRHLLLGSTAERVASALRSPVLLARNPGHRRYREVFVAVALDTPLGPALRAAQLVAPDRPLSVMHAYQGQFETTLMLHGVDPDELASYRAQAKKEARTALLHRLDAAGLARSALVLRHGDARNVLAATRREALLVMPRDEGMLRKALLGSVTRSVVTEGDVDILVV
ncbi:MAG TPA: universal stress protein [Nannocystaceae bacterium]|nr:universal stress protein [Nannocystaceae bacterium]